MPRRRYTSPAKMTDDSQRPRTLKLIREVKKRPELYTPGLSDAKSNHVLWNEIAHAVSKNWESLTPAKKIKKVARCKRRWTSLEKEFRSAVLRSKRSTGGVVKSKTICPFYKQLQFLLPKSGDVSDASDEVPAARGLKSRPATIQKSKLRSAPSARLSKSSSFESTDSEVSQKSLSPTVAHTSSPTSRCEDVPSGRKKNDKSNKDADIMDAALLPDASRSNSEPPRRKKDKLKKDRNFVQSTDTSLRPASRCDGELPKKKKKKEKIVEDSVQSTDQPSLSQASKEKSSRIKRKKDKLVKDRDKSTDAPSLSPASYSYDKPSTIKKSVKNLNLIQPTDASLVSKETKDGSDQDCSLVQSTSANPTLSLSLASDVNKVTMRMERNYDELEKDRKSAFISALGLVKGAMEGDEDEEQQHPICSGPSKQTNPVSPSLSTLSANSESVKLMRLKEQEERQALKKLYDRVPFNDSPNSEWELPVKVGNRDSTTPKVLNSSPSQGSDEGTEKNRRQQARSRDYIPPTVPASSSSASSSDNGTPRNADRQIVPANVWVSSSFNYSQPSSSRSRNVRRRSERNRDESDIDSIRRNIRVEEIDEVHHFVLSLAPMLRRLTDEQRHVARIGILEAIFSARHSAPDQDGPGPAASP